jgi:transglutaminase-like putative cysteine protease
MRPVSIVLAMVAVLLLVFFALTAHAEEPPITILRAVNDAAARPWCAPERTSLLQADEPASALGPYDRLPRVFISSEPDYASFARDYAALVRPHARVTPRIRALAARVAGGVASPCEQARLLYEWVDTHVRYVALYLGNGALEPHDAETVLANGWGDCKDHVVLLQALLVARGIASEMAMLNLGNEYTLSGPPTFAPPSRFRTNRRLQPRPRSRPSATAVEWALSQPPRAASAPRRF